MCVSMLNTTCYVLHMITARLGARVLMQKKAWSVMYHSCLTLMLTQQSSGAGLPLKAWADSPCWDVSTSPRSPITRCYNTSRHQGAFTRFICDSQEEEVEQQNATNQQLTLHCRWVRSVQPLRFFFFFFLENVYCYSAMYLCKPIFWWRKTNKQTNWHKASSAGSEMCLLET